MVEIFNKLLFENEVTKTTYKMWMNFIEPKKPDTESTHDFPYGIKIRQN